MKNATPITHMTVLPVPAASVRDVTLSRSRPVQCHIVHNHARSFTPIVSPTRPASCLLPQPPQRSDFFSGQGPSVP